MPPSARPLIGVDTGGTFTDLCLREPSGELRTAKVPSTPDDPGRAVLAGIEALDAAGADVVHGTTVALNALLTGRVAKAALVTNSGFRDLIEIGRQDRPDIYDLFPRRPKPLVDRARRFEVNQRTHAGGKTSQSPTRAEVKSLKEQLERSGAESVAVCLLHSYADPSIERSLADALASLGLPITCSAEILPAFREVERFSTAVTNAVLVPVLGGYLDRLGRELSEERLSLLQSSGGTLTAAKARLEPVRVLFSGPAGGVVGAARAAREAGLEALVTLDMGGTSTDVAFHDPNAGLLSAVTDAEVAGHPVAVPTLDIHTIGCGGGSLATIDAGGVLHVGPESAGADPGPVAYGTGDVPTVTDACLHLGWIGTGGFVGGDLTLDTDRVAQAFEELGRKLGVNSIGAAEAVLEVARAAMRRAVGVRTMQRGLDPAGLPLVAFGGGGGLHAAALASDLGMTGALVPAHPGVLSAAGMATADASRDLESAVLDDLEAWGKRRRGAVQRDHAAEGKADLRAAGFALAQMEVHHSLELRYRGQSFELSVPEGRDPRAEFATTHRARYGWALEDGELELVSLRTRVTARRQEESTAARKPRARKVPKSAHLGERQAVFAGKASSTAVLDRARLVPGHLLEGPAIIEEYSGTTVLPPTKRARVLPGGHLWIE